MSDRPIVAPIIVIPAASMATNIISAPTIMLRMYAGSYSWSWSGTSPVGTITLQGSNDYALNAAGQVANAGTWNNLEVEYSGSVVTIIPISGNSGTGGININEVGCYAIRIIYTAGSGTGTLSATFNGKVS